MTQPDREAGAVTASDDGPLTGVCWFCHREVPFDSLIAGYDTWDEQRLACNTCNTAIQWLNLHGLIVSRTSNAADRSALIAELREGVLAQAIDTALRDVPAVHLQQLYRAATRAPDPAWGSDDCLYRGEVSEHAAAIVDECRRLLDEAAVKPEEKPDAE